MILQNNRKISGSADNEVKVSYSNQMSCEKPWISGDQAKYGHRKKESRRIDGLG